MLVLNTSKIFFGVKIFKKRYFTKTKMRVKGYKNDQKFLKGEKQNYEIWVRKTVTLTIQISFFGNYMILHKMVVSKFWKSVKKYIFGICFCKISFFKKLQIKNGLARFLVQFKKIYIF